MSDRPMTDRDYLQALVRCIPAISRPGSLSRFLGASCAMMKAYDAARAHLEQTGPASDTARADPPALDAKLFDHAWAMAQAIRGGGPLPWLTPDQAADAAAPYLLSRLEERNAVAALCPPDIEAEQ